MQETLSNIRMVIDSALLITITTSIRAVVTVQMCFKVDGGIDNVWLVT